MESPPRSGTRRVQTILVGIEGHADDERALTILCEALDPEAVRLRIAHVLVVPSNMPFDISMPVAEEHAVRILEEAREIAGRFNIHVEATVLRGRMVGECLAEEAGRAEASAVCVRLRRRPAPWGHHVVSETVSALLNMAPCTVMILHLPHHTAPHAP